MTECDQVETEEKREKKEAEEAKILVTSNAFRVDSICVLKLLDRSGLLEGTEDERRNAEGEDDNENERKTEDD